MKPTVDNILAQHNIRLYNGSWYVHEKKLREMLEQIIEEVYAEGQKDVFSAIFKQDGKNYNINPVVKLL